MSKEKKVKLIIMLFFVTFATVANIYFSTFLHQMLSGEINQIKFFSYNLSDYIESLKVNKNHFMLFISFEILIVLSGIFFLLINNKPYRSNLIRVTPDISIPVPAGQKQFGSARFMTEKEKLKAFPICTLNRNDKLINYLMEHGYDDLSDLSIEDKDNDRDGDENDE